MKITARVAREMREGILDARKETPRPWEPTWPKQGPYWEAYQETRSIIRIRRLFSDCRKQWDE